MKLHGLIRFFGFLAGVTASCGVAYGMLTEDIEKSATSLHRSVAELGEQVSKVRRIAPKFELLLKRHLPKMGGLDQMPVPFYILVI